MSQERVMNALKGFGLTQTAARVYVFLAKKGPQKGSDISKALKMNKQQLYACLKSLQSKGVVSVTLEHPARFSAAPFERAFDLFVKAKMEEVQRVQQVKNGILSDWQSIAIEATEGTAPRFMVINGRNYVFSRIQRMIQDTQHQFSAVSTVPGLLRADQFGLLDGISSHHLESKVEFRFLTELSDQNLNALKTLLKRTSKTGLNFKGRNHDIGSKLFPRMVIRDEEELLLFIAPTANGSTAEQDMCIWTNCKSLCRHSWLFLRIYGATQPT